MIIVSQDKTKIVNFDNLIQIYITQDEEETANFIRYESVDSLYEDLGELGIKLPFIDYFEKIRNLNI